MRIKLLFQKLRVPVRDVNGIEEREPLAIAGQVECLLHERGPFRFMGFSQQEHSCLLRRFPPFVPVTLLAGTNHILPCGCAAFGAGYDMIQIEFITRELPPTVLAGTFVPGIDVIAAEADLPLRHPVISYEEDHSGHAYNPVDQPYGFITDRNGEVTPAFKIKGLILFVHCSGDPLIEEGEGPAH